MDKTCSSEDTHKEVFWDGEFFEKGLVFLTPFQRGVYLKNFSKIRYSNSGCEKKWFFISKMDSAYKNDYV